MKKQQYKAYKTLKPLPGGINVGTIVRYNDVLGWVYDLNKLVSACPFNPSKDTQFFVEFFEGKYKFSDKVYVTENYAKNIVNLSDKNPVIIVSFNNSIKTPKYTCEYNRKRFDIPENELYIPVFYYFINSRGKVCSEILTDSHKISSLYKFRQKMINIFPTSKNASDRFDDIMSGKILFNAYPMVKTN